MTPYDIVGLLLSPLPILALLFAVMLSVSVLYAVWKSAFLQIGILRIATGYLGVLVSVALVSAATVSGGFSLGNFVGVFVGLAYPACFIVAIIVLPLTVALTAYGRGVVGWVLLASSVAGAPVFMASTHLITVQGIGDVSAIRWAYDLLFSAVLVALTSGGFSLGARLPWTADKPA